MTKKRKNFLFLAFLFLLTIALFFLIYQVFRADWGLLPGGELTKGDWLAFLGSYLGFASSTLLAIAVFRQDEKINTLVSDEYDPILIFRVAKFERLSEAAKTSASRYVVLPHGQTKLLFEQFIYDPVRLSPDYNSEETPFRFYLTVESRGKLPVRALSITKIELDSDLCVYEKDIEDQQLVAEMIQPDGIQNLCLKLNGFPRLAGSDVHTLYIHYSAKVSDNTLYKSHYKLLMTGDETTVFDGIDYHT